LKYLVDPHHQVMAAQLVKLSELPNRMRALTGESEVLLHELLLGCRQAGQGRRISFHSPNQRVVGSAMDAPAPSSRRHPRPELVWRDLRSYLGQLLLADRTTPRTTEGDLFATPAAEKARAADGAYCWSGGWLREAAEEACFLRGVIEPLPPVHRQARCAPLESCLVFGVQPSFEPDGAPTQCGGSLLESDRLRCRCCLRVIWDQEYFGYLSEAGAGGRADQPRSSAQTEALAVGSCRDTVRT
jgi:hypothetical protein